jgi:hypothetical protein
MRNTARVIITKVMKTITPTETPPGYFQWIPFLLSGLALIALSSSVPPLTARMALMPSDGAREALLARNAVSEVDLNALYKTRQRALIWRSTADTLDDLALVSLTRAASGKAGSQEAQNEWGNAFYWQRRALGRAPADTFGWTRLAYMLMQTEGISGETATALMRSLDTGPYEPSLMLVRLNMVVPLLDKLDPDVKASLPFMINAAWEYDLEGLAKTAQQNHFVNLVEKALADDPDKLSAFREKISETEDKPSDSAVQKKQ